MRRSDAPYPAGLKPGDFIQPETCFGDVFFEVASCYGPSQATSLWHVSYVTYDKHCRVPRTSWVNGAIGIRRVIPSEMAVPVMFKKRLRFKASFGQYDPILGFAAAVPSPRSLAA